MQVLLYDGLCGFCDSTVQFILARDSLGTIKFSPLQGKFAASILRQRPELESVDSLLLVELADDGAHPQVRMRSDAVLGVARYLGWPWKGAVLLHVVPRFVRDWGYDLFARNRYRWFGKHDACPLPSPAQRERFLE